MYEQDYKPYHDPDVLHRLYHDSMWSTYEIADKFGVSQTTIVNAMRNNGIQTRNKWKPRITPRYEVAEGYCRWRDSGNTVYVHQLLLISEGADPHKVFSNGRYECHHKNGVKWDNRPDNLELLPSSEHHELHYDEKDLVWDGKYTDEEMLSWIDAFVEEFDFVPSIKDLDGWPGPNARTYQNRFGTWKEAIREAGHEPRGSG